MPEDRAKAWIPSAELAGENLDEYLSKVPKGSEVQCWSAAQITRVYTSRHYRVRDLRSHIPDKKELEEHAKLKDKAS